MADFCKQCTIDIFSPHCGDAEDNDAAWGKWKGYENEPRITPDGKPYWVVVLCEGCGYAICLPDGTCINTKCDSKHGVGHPHAVTPTEE